MIHHHQNWLFTCSITTCRHSPVIVLRTRKVLNRCAESTSIIHHGLIHASSFRVQKPKLPPKNFLNLTEFNRISQMNGRIAIYKVRQRRLLETQLNASILQIANMVKHGRKLYTTLKWKASSINTRYILLTLRSKSRITAVIQSH